MTTIIGNDGALARALVQPPIQAEGELAGQSNSFENTVIPFDAPTETSFAAVLRSLASAPDPTAVRTSPGGSAATHAAGQSPESLNGRQQDRTSLGGILGAVTAAFLNPGASASQTPAPLSGQAPQGGVPWLQNSASTSGPSANQSSTQTSTPWLAQAITSSSAPAAAQDGDHAVTLSIGQTLGQESATVTSTDATHIQGQSGANVTLAPTVQTQGQSGAYIAPSLPGQIQGQSSTNVTLPAQSSTSPFQTLAPQSMGLMPMEYMLVPVFAMQPMGLPGASYQVGGGFPLGQGITSPTSALATSASGRATASLRQPFQGSFPISQGFGPTSSTIEPPYDGYSHFHTGLDFATPSGTPIAAAGAGTVVAAGWTQSGFGNEVIIDHGNGLYTLYGHLKQVNAIVGETVQAGQQIGLSGSTGESTGPHLHFGVEQNGVWVDPNPYLSGTAGASPTAPVNQSAGFGTLPYVLIAPYQGYSLNEAIPLASAMAYADPTAFSTASQASTGSIAGATPAAATAVQGQSAGTPASLDSLIQRVAAETNVPASLITAVVHAESGGNSQAKSPMGAKGLMQLMDATAASYGVTNSFDPLQNLTAGAKYLRSLLDQFQGNEQLAIAAYNAGPGAVTQYGGVPPYPETQNYVHTVLAYQQQISGQ